MTAKKPAGCPHRELVLLAYLSNRSRKRGVSLLWCVDCGALCQRDDEQRPGHDLWQLPHWLPLPPNPARKAAPKAKRRGG